MALRQVTLGQAAPFLGVRSLPVGTEDDARYVQYAKNMMPWRQDGFLHTRAGLKDSTNAVAGSGENQALGHFVNTAGTRINFAVVAGQIFTLDAATRQWDVAVTAANFSTASITRTTTGRWGFCEFLGEVVFSDGTNAPFMWDGTSGAGGLTALTNCPALYGRPVIYFAKLLGIKASDRQTFVWSEENAPNTGYEANSYNNAWTLGQLGSEPLVWLQPTEVGLYYARPTGLGLIAGAVTPDFQTTGTQEAISDEVGSLMPFGVTRLRAQVPFMDQFGRPWIIDGTALIPIWQSAAGLFTPAEQEAFGGGYRLQIALATSSSTYWPSNYIVVDELHNAIAFWYTTNGVQRPIALCFNAADPSQYWGVIEVAGTATVVGTYSWLVTGAGIAAGVILLTAARYSANFDRTQTEDELDGAAAGDIAWECITTELQKPRSPDVEYLFDACAVEAWADGSEVLTVTPYTSREPTGNSGQAVTIGDTGYTSEWKTETVGLNRSGRWAKISLAANADARTAIRAVTVRAFVMARDAAVLQ